MKTIYPEDFNEKILQKIMVGKENLPDFTKRSIMQSELIFECKNIAGRTFVKEINLNLYKGQIVGIYDCENRRNQELASIIIGELSAEHGSMYLKGKEFSPKRIEDAIQANIGYIPQNALTKSLQKSMTSTENLLLPLVKKRKYNGLFYIKELKRFLEREYIYHLGVTPQTAQNEIKHFNKYTQYKVLFTRWELCRPDLLVFKKPFDHADMIMINMIYEFLDKMAKSGTTIILSSKNMASLKVICDQIYEIK